MSCCSAAVMSSRTPAELIWHEHSKPPIQNDWKVLPPGGCGAAGLRSSAGVVSPRVMCCVMVLVGDNVLLPLVVHEALPPFPFHLIIALAPRPASCEGDVLDGEFRRAIGV